MAHTPSAASKGPGLVAVLLLTRSRPGPRLVFHYPEKPHADAHFTRRRHDTDDSDIGSDEDDHLFRPGQQRLNSNGDYVLGHSVEGLEKLLSPGRWCNGKKFEVTLNGLTFLGHPVYAPDDGKWSETEEKQKAQTSPTPAPRTRPKYGDYNMYLDPGSLETTPPQSLPRTRSAGQFAHDFTHVPESLESHVGRSFANSMGSDSTASGMAAEQMTMFQVVFVLRPQQKSAQIVYRDVAKKLCKALHYCQKQSNYVSVESRKLLALRSKAKQLHQDNTSLWSDILETSELAWALKEIYERLSAGEVAGIRLNGMEMSLMYEPNREDSEQAIPLEPQSTILLLESREVLLQHLSHPDAQPLAHFVREHLPTKSLQKHSLNIGMPLESIMYLCNHLLKWRKARVISPLSQRNVYVVNPQAPMDRLPDLGAAYTKAFPTLPNLPNMLKVLSGKPIKYGNLIPSRDHRGVYMDILAFLVRHELVVQMKTCGWLRLPKNLAIEQQDPNKRPLSVRSLLSPHLQAVDSDDASSVSSERTAIAPPSKRFSNGPTSKPEGSKENNFVIITHPNEQTEEEARLVAGLMRVLQDDEFRQSLHVILPHLDGESAFEEIAAREGLKRANLEDWLAWLERRGWLIVVRYL